MRSASAPRNESMTIVSKPWRWSFGFSSTAGAEANSDGSAPSFSISFINLLHTFFASFSDGAEPSTRTSRPSLPMALKLSCCFVKLSWSFRALLWAASFALSSFSTARAASLLSPTACICASIALSRPSISSAREALLAAEASASAFLASAAAWASVKRPASSPVASSSTSLSCPTTVACVSCRSPTTARRANGAPTASISRTFAGISLGIKAGVLKAHWIDGTASCPPLAAEASGFANFAGLGAAARRAASALRFSAAITPAIVIVLRDGVAGRGGRGAKRSSASRNE
mmetsp:Transcript_89422/g.273850  ORF Transcript_89422/g.273850 Transcript_89422/m.273850 type:complete len:289 (+) Transcript_89422:884-1750(+)